MVSFEEFFYEQTFDRQSFTAANTPGYNNSSHIRDNRLTNPTGNRTGSKNNPGATNTVSQSNINTSTQTKNKIDRVTQNPASEEILGDMDIQEIQNTNGIDLNGINDNEPVQVNSKLPVAVVRTLNPANNQPVYKLIHYKSVQ